MKYSLIDKISFFNISRGDITLFEWKPPRSFKSFLLDLNIIKQNKRDDIFFHVDKGNLKIAYIRKNNLIYSAGTEALDLQFQTIEALIEHVIIEFNSIYDIDVILSYSDVTPTLFSPFKMNIIDILDNFPKLNLIQKVDVFCRVCDKTLPLYIKRSFIENAESHPAPIVYKHKGHSIICYIDRNFIVRGVELVNITG